MLFLLILPTQLTGSSRSIFSFDRVLGLAVAVKAMTGMPGIILQICCRYP